MYVIGIKFSSTGKGWISGRELGTGERWMRGLLSPLDIVPGVAGMKKFGTGVRLSNQVVDLGQMAVKPSLRSTIKREMVHVGDMINTAGKMTVQRVKNAGLAVKDAASVAKNKITRDLQDVGRVADSAVTSAKNITSTRKVVDAGDIGKVHMPAENTHFFENKAKQMFSKAEDIKSSGGSGTPININNIDSINVINGKVGDKIPVEDFKHLREASLKNTHGDSMTLGKYTPTIENGIENWGKAGPDSYIGKAGTDSMYFDLGSEWGTIQKKYNLTDDEMFQYLNVPALDDAVNSGKQIRFSHDPRLHPESFLEQEWLYLKEKYGYRKLSQEGDVWIAR